MSASFNNLQWQDIVEKLPSSKIRKEKSHFYLTLSTRSVKYSPFPQHINSLTIFLMKFLFFSGVIPLKKVKIINSCGILILEKTENSLESVK